MEHWTSQPRGTSQRSRILASISGNAQSFPPLNTARAVSEPQYPVPSTILRSDDRQAVADRLAARKARRSSHPRDWLRTKSHLDHIKYKNYRARPRQDVGKDAKPIWPDRIEESFQNALIQIPPMGKRKKTQYGRPHGRNELISEWIYQDTGEWRDRKQISSHIQVLSNLLKDSEEWRSLTRKDGEADDFRTDEGPEYYFESIADQVRLQRQLFAEAEREVRGDQAWPPLARQRHHVSKVTFEMFVGMPDKMPEALHNYTRIANKESGLADVPLENYKNWRGLFPDLEPILFSCSTDNLDILFLKSRFSLMSDFPPSTSKLGLMLDLDYRHKERDKAPALGNLKYFTSVNHMYHNGKRFRKTEHKDCPASGNGIVNLFFEAEWWATRFTELTHKRKEAEESKQDSASTIADDYSRSLFHGLTVMQEVFASPAPGENLSTPRRRIAILLWVFAQTSKGSVGGGVTTWQKVIPPPKRESTNSPAVDIDSSLPPLIMDSMMDASFDGVMLDDFSQNEQQIVPMSPAIYEPGSYHSGFTPAQYMGANQPQMFDFTTSTGFTPTVAHFPTIKHETFEFGVPIDVVPSQNSTYQALSSQDHNSILYQMPIHPTYDQTFAGIESYPIPIPSSAERSVVRDSLAHFDMSTHELLQAQLGDFDTPCDTQMQTQEIYELQTQKSPAQQDPDSQHSMIGHMNHLEIEEEQLSEVMIAEPTSPEHGGNHPQASRDHPGTFVSPRVTRPPLHHSKTFAGVMPTHRDENEIEQLTFDTPTRNEFARLMNSHLHPDGTGSDDDLFGSHSISEAMDLHFPSASELSRPRSQPVLPSNEASCFDLTPKQALQAP